MYNVIFDVGGGESKRKLVSEEDGLASISGCVVIGGGTNKAKWLKPPLLKFCHFMNNNY